MLAVEGIANKQQHIRSVCHLLLEFSSGGIENSTSRPKSTLAILQYKQCTHILFFNGALSRPWALII